MRDCIFCKIKNDDNSKLLFSDSICYAIYDKFPATKGHMLVISNKHYESTLKMPDETNAHMFTIAKKLAKRAIKEVHATGINIVANSGKDANQFVMHAHIHVIPRYHGMADEKPHYKVAGVAPTRR
ncbi:MAG: HIT family protein [Candidatus Micrarchaeales archaeon]